MEKFLKVALAPAIRHTMTGAAGYLVAKGIIDAGSADATAQVLTGLVIGGAGYLWSLGKNASQFHATASAKSSLPGSR